MVREGLRLDPKSQCYEEDSGVACDTVYRMVVLFGLEQPPPSSPVWNAVTKFIQGPGKEQFAQDQALASLERGDMPAMLRARTVLAQIPGGEELLRGCVAFDMSRRVSLLEAIASPVFEGLRTASQEGSGPVQEFMHYH